MNCTVSSCHHQKRNKHSRSISPQRNRSSLEGYFRHVRNDSSRLQCVCARVSAMTISQIDKLLEAMDASELALLNTFTVSIERTIASKFCSNPQLKGKFASNHTACTDPTPEVHAQKSRLNGSPFESNRTAQTDPPRIQAQQDHSRTPTHLSSASSPHDADRYDSNSSAHSSVSHEGSWTSAPSYLAARRRSLPCLLTLSTLKPQASASQPDEASALVTTANLHGCPATKDSFFNYSLSGYLSGSDDHRAPSDAHDSGHLRWNGNLLVTDQEVQTITCPMFTEDKAVQTAAVPVGRPPVAPARSLMPNASDSSCKSSSSMSPEPLRPRNNSPSAGLEHNKSPDQRFKETPGVCRQFSLMMTMERWHLPQSKHMCCPWHAATQALKMAERQIMKEPCKPKFKALEGWQCPRCFCVGEEEDEGCVSCGELRTSRQEDCDGSDCIAEPASVPTTCLSADLLQSNTETQTFEGSLSTNDSFA